MSDNVKHPLDRLGWTVTASGCWEWNGSRTEKRGGYGQVSVGGRSGKVMKAHRLAYMRWVGEIPAGMFVCHHCDNPPCINPDHLFIGTNRDNHNDMTKKGRGFVPISLRGEKSNSAKLTEADVKTIRYKIATGVSISQIGREYGVTKQAIWRIKERKTWKMA